MDPQLLSALGKVALPLVAMALVIGLWSRRSPAWREDLGWVAPAARDLVGWVLLWIAWGIATELALTMLHWQHIVPWPPSSTLVRVVRIAALAVLGPIAEELVMRGLILHRLRQTALGTVGAVALVAALWAAMHYRYPPSTIAVVFLDGLVLGAARVKGRSLWIPIAMHIVGNSYAIWQSMHAG